MLPIRKILCPTDFSEPSYEAARAAVELASHFDSELWFLHVVAPAPVVATDVVPAPTDMVLYDQEIENSAKKSLEDVVARLQTKELKTRLAILKGYPADEILRTAEAERADLIVMATHGRKGLDHFVFGSVAERVVRLSACPVLTVRSYVAYQKTKEVGQEAEEATKQEEKRGSAVEAAETLGTYLERIEAQLKEWDAEIDRFIDKVAASSGDVKTKYGKQIDDLKSKREAAGKRLIEMRETGGTAWEGFKSAMNRNMEELKGTYDQAVSKMKRMKEEAAEKASKKKMAYAEKAEAELREWGATVELLKAKANRSKADVKVKYLEEIEKLQTKQEAAKQKVHEFKDCGDEAWADIKSGMDRALADLKKSLGNAASRFKNRET